MLFIPLATAVAPTCVLISRTPSDINDSSHGTFNALINCTSASGINTTKITDAGGTHYNAVFVTRTVDGLLTYGVPNSWSIRPPDNNLTVKDTRTGWFTGYNFFRAHGRNRGFWFDSLQLNSTFTNGTYSFPPTQAVVNTSAFVYPAGKQIATTDMSLVNSTIPSSNTTLNFGLGVPLYQPTANYTSNFTLTMTC